MGFWGRQFAVTSGLNGLLGWRGHIDGATYDVFGDEGIGDAGQRTKAPTVPAARMASVRRDMVCDMLDVGN